jgi:hypothetical protein
LIPQLAGAPRFAHNLMQPIFFRFCHIDLHIVAYPSKIRLIIMPNITQRRDGIQQIQSLTGSWLSTNMPLKGGGKVWI